MTGLFVWRNQGNAAAFDDDSVPCPILIVDDQMFMIVIGLPNLEINIHQIWSQNLALSSSAPSKIRIMLYSSGALLYEW